MMDGNRGMTRVGRAARAVAKLAGLLTVSTLAGGCSLLPLGRPGAAGFAPRAIRPEIHETAVRDDSDCLALAAPVPAPRAEAVAIGQPDAPAEGPGCSACACTAGDASTPAPIADLADGRPSTGEAVLQRLMDGNKRFVEGEAENLSDWPQRPGEPGRRPAQAMVLACSDWNILPEAAFDAKAGELVVVRVTGNAADAAAVFDSARDAVQRDGVSLIIVLGHKGCDAVGGAGIEIDGDAFEGRAARPAGAQADAAVTAAHEEAEAVGAPDGDASAPVVAAAINRAVRANVDDVIARIRRSDPALSTRIAEGRLKIVGACYDEANGLVTLQPDGHDAAEGPQLAATPRD